MISANIGRVEGASLLLAHEYYARGQPASWYRTWNAPARCRRCIPGHFCGYTHRPGQLRDEIEAAGLDVLDLVSVEGLAFALADLEERLANPAGRQLVLGTAEVIERVPELLGLGPHLLATARRQ